MPHFTAPDGISLWYEEAGQGLPLLCLSGLTRNARDFDFVAPHLRDVRMIRMDYRGRGKSDWADWSTYDVKVEAKDALALLDHLGLDRVAVLGTSRGAVIAMLLAAIAKDRLLGVALNDAGPEVDPRGLAAIREYLGRNPEGRTLEEVAQGRMAATARDFPGVPIERWRQVTAGNFVEANGGVRINYDPELRTAVVKAAEALPPGAPPPDMWPIFDLIAPLPCAVIQGVNSDILSSATVEEMARRNPDLIVARVPDRAHIPFLDEPEALDALSHWLDRMR